MTQEQADLVKTNITRVNEAIAPTRLVYTSSHHTGSPFWNDYENSWWIEIVFEQRPRLARMFYDCSEALCFLDGITKAFDYIECTTE